MSQAEPREGENLEITNLSGRTRLAIFMLGLASIIVGIYLTDHYYSAFFPRPALSGAFCNISSYWNCDSATFSALSNIFGIPTAIFGLFFGCLMVFGTLIKSRRIEETNYFLAIVNALGCVGLFIYSLLVLRSLCPGCTLYYTLSLTTTGVFAFARSVKPLPSAKVLVTYGGIFACVALAVHLLTLEMEKEQQKLEQTFIEEFDKSTTYEGIALHSPFFVVGDAEQLNRALLRISLFSDYQCPLCGYLANDMLPKIAKRYGKDIAIQYFHYPLDHNCHPKITNPFHQMACKAAYLSSCSGKHFLETHDWLYSNQAKLNDSVLQVKVNELDVNACYYSEETKDKIVEEIQIAETLGIDATPTLIINGRKLDGIIPLRYVFALMDHVLKQELEKKKKEVALNDSF